MKEEIWKDVEGYEEKYMVSTFGRVWNKYTDSEVAQVLTGVPQYKYVNLHYPGKTKLVRVHRLVALAHIPKVEDCNIVDHIDRNKLNNHISNLRWVDHSGNQRNTELSTYVEYEGESLLLVELCERLFGEIQPHYAYLVGCLSRGLTVQEGLDNYETYKRIGLKQIRVEFEGTTQYLADLCNTYGVNYEDARTKLNIGWEVWDVLHKCPPLKQGIEVKQEDGTCIWFGCKEVITKYTGRCRDIVNRGIEENWTVQEMIEYKVDTRKDYTIDGVTKKREEWIKYYETSESRVQTNMTRLKIPFEEAVKIPPERVSKILLNGEKMTVKSLWERFGLDPKKTTTYRSKFKLTFKEALDHFGVNTENLHIEPV